MLPIKNGLRPRPRVGLIGNFDKELIDRFKLLFPTTWSANTIQEMVNTVNPLELDLAIFASDVLGSTYELAQAGVSIISFSTLEMAIKWPSQNLYVQPIRTASTEQFILPELPLGFARLREINLSGIETIKGWILLEIKYYGSSNSYNNERLKEVSTACTNSSLILDPFTQLSFAFVYQNHESKQGLAWLPNPVFRVFPWVELICTEWAKTDPERFPNFGDWTKMQEWMTKEEKLLAIQLDAAEVEKQKLIIEFNQKIGLLQEDLLKSSIVAKGGVRRLITEQGGELVNEVSSCLETLGFVVINMDGEKTAGSPKLEDLRIQDINDPDWEAIIEVRGYSKSGGTTDDLARIARFARHYQAEKGKYPSKRIYIVNGQIDLPPSQRQAPLISSPNDVEEFGEQDGIIIWSLDLFRLLKNIDKTDLPTIRKLIKDTKGRFIYKE